MGQFFTTLQRFEVKIFVKIHEKSQIFNKIRRGFILVCSLLKTGKSIFFISTTSVLELLSVSVSRIDVVGTKLIERVRMLYKKDVDTITEAVAGDKKEVLTLINHCLAAHQVNHQQIYYQRCHQYSLRHQIFHKSPCDLFETKWI